MKILLKAFIILIIVTFILVVFNHYFMTSKSYEKDYFGKAGIKGSFFYDSIIDSKGVPLNEKTTTEYGHDYMQSVYNGFVFNFSKQSTYNKSEYMLGSIIITDPQYKLGKYDIGIGSTFNNVKKAYRRIKEIKDVYCGYIDASTWIEFRFDAVNKVNQIIIYNGP